MMKNHGYEKTRRKQTDDINAIAENLLGRTDIVREYYYSLFLSIVSTIVILMVLSGFALITWLEGIVYSDLPVEGRVVLPLILLFICALHAYLILKVWSPILIIKHDGFLCHTGGSLGKVKILWDSIVNVTEDEPPASAFKQQKRLKIIFERKNSTNGRVILTRNSFRNGDEALSLIKTIASGKINEDEKCDTQKKAKSFDASSIKVDSIVALLIISGFIIGIGGLLVLTFYPPTIGSTWLYPLLILPLSGVPLFLTIKMLLSAARDKSKTTSTRVAAFGFNIGTICAVAFMFLMSPASTYWILADFYGICGKADRAEFYYQKAETDLSGNADFLYAFAQMYYQDGDWENAARYYIDSYEKNPTNWMKGPLRKVVDALDNAGKSDEALDWCDRIIQDYSRNKRIVKVFEREKEKITSAANKM